MSLYQNDSLTTMARKAQIEKSKRYEDHSTKGQNRCQKCERARGYIRKFGLCQICFREKTLRGEIPGVRPASW